MGLQHKAHSRHVLSRPHHKASKNAASRLRICRFEQMESRQLLSVTVAPIHVATTYFEDSNETDQSSPLQGTNTQVADLFQVSFTGGADGTNLTSVTLNLMNTFFNTENAAPGVYGFFPLTIINHDGFEITSSSVVNGGTQLKLNFSGFGAGDKLVFSIDVDENGNLEANAVVEGAELEGATMTASFTAAHMADTTVSNAVFYDDFAKHYPAFSSTAVSALLPNDNYDNAVALAYMPEQSSPGPVYTALAYGTVTQTPLPITLSGTVFEDFNSNLLQDSGDPGIAGVTLTLNEYVNGSYVSTGKTTITDSLGKYTFTGLLPSTYQVVETQPSGYLSVGDTPGTVNGATRGVVTTVDILSSINLDGGEDSVHNDFAEVKPASVSGYVYVDANNNGVFDQGETPIAGAQLSLLDAQGNATGKTATTDSSGFYQFDNLAPGTYGVAEAQPAGYLDGLDAAGTAGGAAHNPGDLIDAIPLSSGTAGLKYNFGELLPASISGYVYVDSNNNGIFDEGETPIAGVQLSLLNAQGNATGKTAVTDSSGFYQFDNLTPGMYGVAETQPAGYLDGLDMAGTAGGTAHNPGDLIDAIVLQSGAAAKKNNFGELLPASIRGRVYVDMNNNGALDSGDPLLSGVTIYLLDSTGGRVASTTTDANGKYAFTDLKPGVYGVEEIQPANYLEGSDQVGSAGGRLDGADRILEAQLGSGVDGVNYDFYEVMPAKISGYVFQDGPAIVVKEGDPPPNIPALRDGKLTPDDTRLSGVVLQLCDGSGYPMLDSQGNPITTVTDADGYYEFNMLMPGVYSVIENQPASYVPGVDTAGSKGGLIVNRYSVPETKILSTLAVKPEGSAIVRIAIISGDSAVQYNFSEVLIQTQPPTPPPPPFYPPNNPMTPTPPPMPLPFAEYQPVSVPYFMMPPTILQPFFGGGGGPGGYTWHLSVIDAGFPRQEVTSDAFTQTARDQIFDPVSWTGADLGRSQWILADKDGVPIKKIHYGVPGSTPVTGDWDGTGTTKIGVFIDGVWFLDVNGNGVWDSGDLWVRLGKKGDQPITGDWNGDGKTDIGIFGPTWIGDLNAVAVDPGLPDALNPPAAARPKNVPPDVTEAAVGWRTMKKGNNGKMRSDLIDHVFQYGGKEDVAVTGDWNGDGVHSIGIFRKGTWFLDMDGNGRWSKGDLVVEFGQEGDIPIVGDWTGDGISKLGVYRNGTFILDTNNNHKIDAQDKVFELGGPGDKPVAGDWDGDGVDEVGIFQDDVVPDKAA